MFLIPWIMADEITLWNPCLGFQMPSLTYQSKAMIQGEVKANEGIKGITAFLMNLKSEKKDSSICQVYYGDSLKYNAVFKTELPLSADNSILVIEVLHENGSTFQQTFILPIAYPNKKYGDFTQLTSASIHEKGIRSMQFSPDSRYIITTGDDDTVRVLESTTLKIVKTLRGHKDSVTQAFMTRDNKTAISCSYDRSIKIWDIAQEKCVYTIYDRDILPFNCMAISPDERYAATGTMRVKIWDLKERRFVRQCKLLGGGINKIIYSADGSRIFTGDTKSCIRTWKTADGDCDYDRYHSGPITSLAACPSLRYLYSGDIKSYFKRWQLLIDPSIPAWADENKMWELRCYLGKKDWDDPLNTKDYKAFADKVKYYSVYSLKDCDTEELDIPYNDFSQVSSLICLQLNSTGEFLLMATREGDLRIHETATAICRMNTVLQRIILSAAFAPNGTLFAAGDTEGKVWLYGLKP